MRNKEKGITLIALIITIIVMLILVGVVVTVVIQSNLLGTAKTSGDKYKTAYEDESNMSEVTINGKKYGSIEEYMEEINPTIVEPDNIDDWGYKLKEDNSMILEFYKGKDANVVIPNYINGKPVKKISGTPHIGPGYGNRYPTLWHPDICYKEYGYNFFQKTIEEVDISYGIEEIGDYAFYSSMALKKINIPNSVVTIGEQAFLVCESLTEITIPSSVTTMGSRVFGNNITVHVPWKEGKKPEGWADDWAKDHAIIDYAK